MQNRTFTTAELKDIHDEISRAHNALIQKTLKQEKRRDERTALQLLLAIETENDYELLYNALTYMRHLQAQIYARSHN